MINTLITPEEISTLARPCYADEEKALAYIVEAEQNNIKPAIGDDLFIQLKEGGQTFLLEGGIYERNGKRYYLNGIKKALAYFVISRLYESSTTELTRQGAVNRRSEYSDNADNSEIISVSRETYAIANRYMEEVEKYLGTDVKNTSQRVRFDLVGGGTPSKSVRPSYSSSGGSSADLSNYATKDYVREEIAKIDIPELPTLAEVAETGDYNDLENLPDLSVYAVNTDIKTSLSKKQDKTTRREIGGVNSITINPNEYTIITLDRDVTITLMPLPQNRNYAEHYEFDIITGDEVYEVGFANANSHTWAKELVIEPNKIYKFYVDCDYTIIWQAIERSDI